MASTAAEAYIRALDAIDAAHSGDPNRHISPTGEAIPYELHYARQMSHYLQKLASTEPSHTLSLAIRAQHFRRWEVPRSSYPEGRLAYLRWRTDQKSRAATQVRQICLDNGISESDADRVAALIRKENLKKDEEAQMLEDAACLVFLDDQFEEFEKGFEGGEEKMLGILRKTWGKMSEKGRDEALRLNVGEKGKQLLGKALATGQVPETRGDVKKEGYSAPKETGV